MRRDPHGGGRHGRAHEGLERLERATYVKPVQRPQILCSWCVGNNSYHLYTAACVEPLWFKKGTTQLTRNKPIGGRTAFRTGLPREEVRFILLGIGYLSDRLV